MEWDGIRWKYFCLKIVKKKKFRPRLLEKTLIDNKNPSIMTKAYQVKKFSMTIMTKVLRNISFIDKHSMTFVQIRIK